MAGCARLSHRGSGRLGGKRGSSARPGLDGSHHLRRVRRSTRARAARRRSSSCSDEAYGVDDVAADAGTIGYEILTALGRRYHRVYRGAAGADAEVSRLDRRAFLGFSRRHRAARAVRWLAPGGGVHAALSTRARSCAQMVDIGYFSLPVVGLTAIFTGMVLALQTYTGFSRFAAESAVATVVVLSVTRELGPVHRRADGGRPRRRRHGGRDRHDARHRADRRADHPVHRPAAISGAAAADRRR